MDNREDTPFRLSMKWPDSDTVYIDILIKGTSANPQGGAQRPGDTADVIGRRLREAIYRASTSDAEPPGRIPPNHLHDVDVGWTGPLGTGSSSAWVWIANADHVDVGAVGKILTRANFFAPPSGGTPIGPPSGGPAGRSPSGGTTPTPKPPQPFPPTPGGTGPGGKRVPPFRPTNTGELEGELGPSRPVVPVPVKEMKERLKHGEVKVSVYEHEQVFRSFAAKLIKLARTAGVVMGAIRVHLLDSESGVVTNVVLPFPCTSQSSEVQAALIASALQGGGFDAILDGGSVCPLLRHPSRWTIAGLGLDLTVDSRLGLGGFRWAYSIESTAAAPVAAIVNNHMRASIRHDDQSLSQYDQLPSFMRMDNPDRLTFRNGWE